ncbi:MAG: OmpA family protein [Pseudomonadota bacterium]|nr:OmpA family protein [Pseudomonadota bacterium]
MKRKSLYALIALIVAGSSIGTAQAVDYGNWYIAPRLGVLVPDSKRDTQNSVLAGLGVGFWVNPKFAVDLEYTINDADYKSSSPYATRQWQTQSVGVTGRYFLGNEQGYDGWRPYVAGGLDFVGHDAFMSRSGWGPGFLVGGGVQRALTDRVALRGEIDYRWNRDTVSLPTTSNYGDWAATLGLVISMAPPPPPPPPPAAAPPPPPPPPPPPEPAAHKVVIELRGVNFQFDRPRPGQTDINGILDKPIADSVAILDQAADTLKRYPNVEIKIDGYTDSIGSQAYNLKLSDRRAEFVKHYLVSHGVAESQIIGTKGYGKLDPVASNATAEGRSRNRRVEFKVENPGQMGQ